MQWEFNPSGAQATLDTSSRFAVQQTSTWRCLGQGAFFSLLEGNRRTWDPTKGTNPPNWPGTVKTMVKDPLRTPSASDMDLRPTIQIFAPCTNEHVIQDMHHTPNDNTTGNQHRVLAVGYENPAFDPHSLIIAGDVEQNPGPIQPAKQPVCHGCKCVIIPRLLPLAFTCNQAQCERNCHREEKCSKLIHSKTKTWFCMDHIHLSSATPNITSRGDKQTRTCAGRKMRSLRQ